MINYLLETGLGEFRKPLEVDGTRGGCQVDLRRFPIPTPTKTNEYTHSKGFQDDLWWEPNDTGLLVRHGTYVDRGFLGSIHGYLNETIKSVRQPETQSRVRT